MTVTWNGWTAWPDLPTTVIEPVPGVKLRVRKDKNVEEVFTYLVRQYHKRVDDLTKPHPMDDWGFNYRPNVNNPSKMSRHSFGLAVDLDATEHPNGVSIGKTFSKRQIDEVHEILRELGGIVRWGGDYTHTVDGMHFEINVSPQQLAEIWARIKKQPAGTKPPVQIVPKKQRKTQPQLVREVLAGLWGNGVDRERRLTKAGYNYDAVQAAVTAKLRGTKALNVVVQEVIDGKWGNGSVRVNRLRAAGYNVDRVQSLVNRRLQ